MNDTPRRKVFYVSDRTGITVETLGEMLLTQFPGIAFERVHIPFVTTPEKTHAAVARIRAAEENDPLPPIVFSTLIDPVTQAILSAGARHVFDLFGTFIGPLEQALGQTSSHTAGKMHGIGDRNAYERRMRALHFTLDHDDGIRVKDLDAADVVLIGVSRTGKTPTSLYLAMHYHVAVANYPLSEEELAQGRLPEPLKPQRAKLFGLTITPEQLARIREERRPGSRYASLAQCRREVAGAEALFRAERIPYIDTTAISVEEIATTVVQHFGIERPAH